VLTSRTPMARCRCRAVEAGTRRNRGRLARPPLAGRAAHELGARELDVQPAYRLDVVERSAWYTPRSASSAMSSSWRAGAPQAGAAGAGDGGVA